MLPFTFKKCFLSHRYGTKFLKSTIQENEFELIRKEASSKIPYKHITSLLDYCYELDENSIKKRSYKLKNESDIMVQLKVSCSNTNTWFRWIKICPSLNGQLIKINDEKEWKVQTDLLVDRIRVAVDNLYKTGAINETERDKYFISGNPNLSWLFNSFYSEMSS